MSKAPKTFESQRGKVLRAKTLPELRALLVSDLQTLENIYQRLRDDIVALEVIATDHEARIVVLEP